MCGLLHAEKEEWLFAPSLHEMFKLGTRNSLAPACLCFFLSHYSIYLSILLAGLLGAGGGDKKWQQTKWWNKSSVSILADIVVDTHRHTHPPLAGFTTPCILLGLVLAGKLKDSLKDHLTDEEPTHTHTHTCIALSLLLLKTFLYSDQLMRESKWPD